MYYTTPITTTATSQQQASNQSSVLSEMSQNNVTDAFKAIKLRQYLEKETAKNEKAKIVSGVNVVDFQSGETIYNHNGDVEQFSASLNKVPVADLLLCDLRSGKITLDTVITWQASDRRAGEGAYDQDGAATQATVRDLLTDMLNRSGNTSFRVFVVYALNGAAAVNDRIKTELQLNYTYLQPLPDNPNLFYLGQTTPNDSLAAIRVLLSGNDQYQKFVKNALVTNIYTNYGVKSQLQGNTYITLANKVGFLDDPTGNNRHDTGLIYNSKTQKIVGYSLMNTAPGESYEQPTAQAGASLANNGAAILRYAGDKPVKSDQGVLPQAKTPKVDKKILY